MATPEELANTTISADKASEALTNLQQKILDSGTSLNTLSGIAKNASSSVGGLAKSYAGINGDLQNMNTLTTSQTNRLGALAVAAQSVNIKDAFNFNDIDTSGLSLVSNQVTDVIDKLGGGNIKNIAANFSKMMSSLGVKDNVIADVAAQGIESMIKFAQKTGESTDRFQKLQNAMLQNAATTGTLGDLYGKAGGNLSNMNQLVTYQSEVMKGAADSTHLSKEQVLGYYGQLAKVPEALNSVITNTGGANNSTSMLVATMQMAAGTGRKYSDIISDITKAYENYGLVGEQALKFTAQISELSSNLGVPLELVRKSLLSSSEAFKGLADAQESAGKQSSGIAQIMGNYFESLKSSGATSSGAISIIENMTKAVSGLSLAQKSFLSQQTGGPGGLMGGFQIEKMLREGQTEKVFEMVRKQMQQQFGKIVNLDAASQSEAAAAQMQKQMVTLKQGPLGQFAKTDEDAIRLLEAFQKRDSGQITGKQLSETVVQDQVKKGSEIQSLSNTPFSAVRTMLENMTFSADIVAWNAAQEMFTERKGSADTADTEAQKKMRDELSKNRQGQPLPPRNITVQMAAAQSAKNVENMAGSLPKMFGGGSVAGSLISDEKPKIQPLSEYIPSNEKYDPSKTLKQATNQVVSKEPEKGIALPTKEVAHAHTEPKEMNFKVNVHSICTVCGHDVGYSTNAQAIHTAVNEKRR